jgi:hypothetical protein
VRKTNYSKRNLGRPNETNKNFKKNLGEKTVTVTLQKQKVKQI